MFRLALALLALCLAASNAAAQADWPTKPVRFVIPFPGGSFADTLRPSCAAEHDPLSPGSQDRCLVEFFARYLERNGTPGGPSTLTFGTLGTGAWQAVTSWPPAGAGTPVK